MSSLLIEEDGDYRYKYEDGQPFICMNAGDAVWTALSRPSTNARQRTILGRLRATEGPFTWKHDGQDWKLDRVNFKDDLTASAPPGPASKEGSILYLVREMQAEGEFDHWYIFVAEEGQKGSVYQVTGDCEHMTYAPQKDINRLLSESFRDAFVLANGLSESDLSHIERTAASETPPSARSRAEVKETCQGWAYRVVGKLVDVGMVSKDKLLQAEKLREPI